MGYASIVGRVGALAVALGVGAAVATTIPAIAYAAPMDSESGTLTDASSPADTPSSLTSSSAPPAAGSSSGGSGSPGRSGSPNALVSSARSLSQSVRNNASRVVVRSSGGAHTVTAEEWSRRWRARSPRSGTQENGPVGLDASDVAREPVTPAQSSAQISMKVDMPDATRWLSSTVNASVQAATDRTRTLAAESAAAQSVSVADEAQPTILAQATAPTAAPGAATRALLTVTTETRAAAAPATPARVGADPVAELSAPPAAPVQVATRTPASAPTDVADTVVRLVSSLAAAASGSLPAPGPQGPASPSAALLVVLAGVRNEIEQTLFKETTATGVHPVSALSVDRSGSVAEGANPVQSPNLLVNPGAELGDPSLSGYSSVTVPGWTVTGTPTVIKYGTLRRLPFPFAQLPTLPACLGFPSSTSEPDGVGVQFFGGGPVASSTLTQTVNLTGAASRSTPAQCLTH